jgi:hypothetical protein
MPYLSSGKTYDYGISAARPDLPASCSSSALPRPINSQVQIVTIASTSGSQNAGGLVSFQIPTGSGTGYLKSNSLYLRCRITIGNAAALTTPVSFALKSRSAASIISRLSQSLGGTQISQYTNYHLLHEMLIQHTTSRNYYENDSAIMQSTNSDAFAQGAAANATIDVVIPVISPLFNGNKSLPLFLLNAPVNVIFELNSIVNAFYTATVGDVPSYTVSQAQLVYEVLQVDGDFINEIKNSMMQGALYQLNLNDYYTLSTTSTASLNYQIGCNYSSVRGVIYSQVKSNPALNAFTYLIKNGQTNFRLYLDGRQMNNFDLAADSQVFAEMNRALGNMFDPNTTSNTTRDNYSTHGFVGGVSTNRVSDMMAMTGSKCQQIQFVLESAVTVAANTYIVVLFDSVLTIDAVGNVLLIK